MGLTVLRLVLKVLNLSCGISLESRFTTSVGYIACVRLAEGLFLSWAASVRVISLCENIITKGSHL